MLVFTLEGLNITEFANATVVFYVARCPLPCDLEVRNPGAQRRV